MEYINPEKNIKIVAETIDIAEHVEFGNNINVVIRGDFKIGKYSRLGDNTHIRGNNISFGEHLFNSSGLRIGGGGRQYPNANFSIGDRCTIHNNFINVCEPVKIGSDVGLSPDTSILTHGYWLSVLEGNPATFSGVTIGNSVIIGYKSLIMMGVNIVDNIVVGAQTTVTKNLSVSGIYAGVPARFIKALTPLDADSRIKKIAEIIEDYTPIAQYHHIEPKIKLEYPNITVSNFGFNVETFEFWGKEDAESDDFRDYIRKFGIRIYTGRPFVSQF